MRRHEGHRASPVISELRGEKIDIMSEHEEITTFAKSLSGEVAASSIVDLRDSKSKSAWTTRSSRFAIGKEGQNVRRLQSFFGDVVISSLYSMMSIFRRAVRE